jgi:hypothetical protein
MVFLVICIQRLREIAFKIQIRLWVQIYGLTFAGRGKKSGSSRNRVFDRNSFFFWQMDRTSYRPCSTFLLLTTADVGERWGSGMSPDIWTGEEQKSNRYFTFVIPVFLTYWWHWWVIFMFGRKRILGGLKAYLRATDHTSSNIISRDIHFLCSSCDLPMFRIAMWNATYRFLCFSKQVSYTGRYLSVSGYRLTHFLKKLTINMQKINWFSSWKLRIWHNIKLIWYKCYSHAQRNAITLKCWTFWSRHDPKLSFFFIQAT